MDSENKNKPWWEPAIEIFGKVSSWVVVPILSALFLGKYLDNRFDTAPWAFLSLSGIAFIISMHGIILTVQKYIQKIEKEENGRDKPQQHN